MNKTTFILIGIVVCMLLGGYFYGQDCYKSGYKAGYDAGFAAANEQLPKTAKADTIETVAAVKTETVAVVRPKVRPEDPAIVIKTEAPVIQAKVNGKSYEFKPKTEVLASTTKTTASLNIRVPERAWKIGIGIDNRKRPAYMLSAPIRGAGAVGVWVAGSSKDRVMGGLSFSF